MYDPLSGIYQDTLILVVIAQGLKKVQNRKTIQIRTQRQVKNIKTGNRYDPLTESKQHINIEKTFWRKLYAKAGNLNKNKTQALEI